MLLTTFDKHLLTLIRDDPLCSMIENIKCFHLKIYSESFRFSLIRSRKYSGTSVERNGLLAVRFSFLLPWKAVPEPNRATPCVLGAPRNINSIKPKLEQSTNSGRQEACWGLGNKRQARTGRRKQSTARPAANLNVLHPDQSDRYHSLPIKGSQDPQNSLPHLPLLHPCLLSGFLVIHFSSSFNPALLFTCSLGQQLSLHFEARGISFLFSFGRFRLLF
jgi:hypothetical protein